MNSSISVVDSNKKTTHFLSLRWKVFFLLGLLLTTINGSLTYFGYHYLQQMLADQLSDYIESSSSSLIISSQQKLLDLAAAITLAGDSEDNGGLTAQSLKRHLNNKWDILQINYALESVVLIDQAGTLTIQQGSYQPNEHIVAMAQQVTENYEPVTRISCRANCSILAAVPQSFADGSTQTVVLSFSLVDYILEFSQQNDLGVVLLRKHSAEPLSADSAAWGYRIDGVTNRGVYQPLLKSLEAEVRIDRVIRQGVSLEVKGDKFYYFHGVAIKDVDASDDNILLLISDISEQRMEIYRDLYAAVSIFVVGSLLTMVVLLLVLRKPMSRMSQLAELLPLLAESGFKRLRSKMPEQQSVFLFHDELDVVDQTAVFLSHKLEKMEAEIQGRTSELEYMALHDVLTGLANRRQYIHHLNSIIKDCETFGERFAVVFIDLDNFKRINDSLGHEAGDELLIEVSRRLTKGVRETDIVARFGGDEFTLLLPQLSSISNVVDIMEKLLCSFQKTIVVSGKEIMVTPSIGIAVGPDNGKEAVELMRCADMAMYEAKQEGKNCYHFFTDEMNNNVQRVIRIENELCEGIDYNQFRLYYQPLVDFRTGKVVSLEGLLRWNHPTKGLLGPVDFIDILESNGQIVLLGPQIFEMACLDLRLLQKLGLDDLTIAINISAKQFHDVSFVKKFLAVFEKTGISASSLKLEITENTLMVDIDRQVELMYELKAMGFKLSIDDFGTGYSSLSYLKKLPVDELKIDRSFVMDIPDNSDDMEITAAITEMAHKLRLKVVAEGVETAEQQAFLKGINCDYGQGYLYHRPEALEKLIPYLQQNCSKER